tara:strand:+ start:1694 stop:3319 length:1626 start_codon:yes stop_codon:yes gene_type:complete
MSQTKVQLIQPVGIMTAPGVNVSGTLTATTFDGNLVGAAGSIIGTPNVNAGIVTAVSFYGNGENLTGVAGSTFIGVVTAAQSGTTTIDLSLGNIIYFTQDTNTTVAFANTESVQVVDFIRDKDATTDARTITWPASIIWNGGTEPTLIDSSQAGDVQIFKLITRDQGVTWYGYETMKNDPAEPISLFLWGDNTYGELGQNNLVKLSSPTQIPGTGWSYLSIGGGSQSSVGVIRNDGTLLAWGEDGQGILAQSDPYVPRSSPVQIPGTEWSRIQVNRYAATFATKTDGTVWAWGDNSIGHLAQNDRVYRSSPIQVPGTWNNESLSANYGSGFCKKTDGTLWAWGYNYYGDLGINDRAHRSSPAQIPGTQWATVKATYGITLATKTDGTLWSWGNLQGLGINSSSNHRRSSPTQIPGTQWDTGEFALGGDRYVLRALKTDGTLWSWGFNGNGQLGQNNVVHYSSPTQIPGTSWKAVNVSASHNQSYVGGLCTKTDGTLWTWGSNSAGRLGLNDTINRSSPIQLPGTGWKDNLCSGVSSGAIKQ